MFTVFYINQAGVQTKMVLTPQRFFDFMRSVKQRHIHHTQSPLGTHVNNTTIPF